MAKKKTQPKEKVARKSAVKDVSPKTNESSITLGGINLEGYTSSLIGFHGRTALTQPYDLRISIGVPKEGSWSYTVELTPFLRRHGLKFQQVAILTPSLQENMVTKPGRKKLSVVEQPKAILLFDHTQFQYDNIELPVSKDGLKSCIFANKAFVCKLMAAFNIDVPKTASGTRVEAFFRLETMGEGTVSKKMWKVILFESVTKDKKLVKR